MLPLALMDTSMLLLAAFLLLPLLAFLLLRPSTPKNLPPGPRPIPIIGNLLQLGRQPHATLARMAREYGSLFSLRLGSELVVVASSPAAAQEVFKTHDRALSGRQVVHVVRAQDYAEHSMVWSEECNEHWKRARRIFHMELLGPKMMNAQANVRERNVLEMVASLKEREGEVVEIGKVVFETVFNLLGNLVFSTEDSTSGGNFKNLFGQALQLAGAVSIEDYFPVLAKLDVFGNRREVTRIREQVFESWKGRIAQRRAGTRACDSKHDFLDVLLDAGLSDAQINALLLDIFLAGTDTTSLTVEWAMAELIKNPEIMNKLRHELEREIGGHVARESNLSGLQYLHACVKETLRLHPPVPFVPRRAVDTCTLMKYTIPKGCQVLVNVWAIGRDQESWENPLIFSPERFMNSSLDTKGFDSNFIPFGGGRRSCPGVPLAAMQVPFILASLIHNFEWSLANGMHTNDLIMDEKFGLTLGRKTPLLLVCRACH